MNAERRPIRKAATDFLQSLARYVSTASLYAPGHPTREAALERVFDSLQPVLEEDPGPAFSFLRGRVVYGDVPLEDLRDWPWAKRLADAGIQRLEIRRGVEREELSGFLHEVLRRLGRNSEADAATSSAPDGELTPSEEAPSGGEAPSDGDADGRDPDGTGRSVREGTGRSPRTAEANQAEYTEYRNIRFGTLGLRLGEGEGFGEGPGLRESLTLGEEAEAVAWIHQVAEEEGRIPPMELAAVVRSLAVAMHSARHLLVPYVEIKDSDRYTSSHCINVAILSMRLAEEMDMASEDVHAVGGCGLLHDVGKTRIPEEILDKTGGLNEREWQEVRRHPVEGCRMLLESEGDLALPATVAYEHHMHPVDPQEGGYPRPRYPRRPARASRLVQVCDFYDALRTERAYRSGLAPDRASAIMRKQAEEGMLDPEFVEPFLKMIRRWDPAETLEEERPQNKSRPSV